MRENRLPLVNCWLGVDQNGTFNIAGKALDKSGRLVNITMFECSKKRLKMFSQRQSMLDMCKQAHAAGGHPKVEAMVRRKAEQWVNNAAREAAGHSTPGSVSVAAVTGGVDKFGNPTQQQHPQGGKGGGMTYPMGAYPGGMGGMQYPVTHPGVPAGMQHPSVPTGMPYYFPPPPGGQQGMMYTHPPVSQQLPGMMMIQQQQPPPPPEGEEG
jgi:hypothetical protein